MIDICKIEELSIEAGNAIMELRKNGFITTQKADGSPVTDADLLADQIITDGLKAIAPDTPVISEETWHDVDQLKDEPVDYWCVDPIDGTKNFISGNKDFTINIALIRQNYPVLGVIYAPAHSTLWAGGHNKAWKRKTDVLNDKMNLEDLGEAQSLAVRMSRLNAPDIVATKAHRCDVLNRWIEKLGVNSSNSVGSSLKFCMIAEGKADLYPRISPTMEWDTAAGQAILEAAGGRMIGTDLERFYYGKDLRLNGRFSAMGKIDGSVPELWTPPQSEQKHQPKEGRHG